MEFSQGDKKHAFIPVACFLDYSEDQGPFGSAQTGLEQMLQDLIRDLQIPRFHLLLRHTCIPYLYPGFRGKNDPHQDEATVPETVPELQHSQPTPAYCSKRKSWI